jgi:hypothetical protein
VVVKMRLYYLSSDNYLQEFMWSGNSWSQGTLAQQAFAARSESQLAVLLFQSTNELRLYYQLSNSTIQELSYSGNKWNLLPQGSTMPRALAGSGLGAGNLGSGNGLRLWFQEEDYSIHEWCWGLVLSSGPVTHWMECMFSFSLPLLFVSPIRLVVHMDAELSFCIGTETAVALAKNPTPKARTPIAGVVWDIDNTPEIKILYQTDNSTIVDATWQDNKNWVEEPLPTADAGNVATGNIAVMVTNSGGKGAVGNAFYMTDGGVRTMTWYTPGGKWDDSGQAALVLAEP